MQRLVVFFAPLVFFMVGLVACGTHSNAAPTRIVVSTPSPSVETTGASRTPSLPTATEVPRSRPTSAISVVPTNSFNSLTPGPTSTVVLATPTPSLAIPTALRPTPAPVPATPTTVLTASQIAATAVAQAVGEKCVAAPPKPAKGFVGNAARGKVLYVERGCSSCHGAQAQGDIGPKLAGTTLSFQAVIHQLREPRGVMQRYLPADQSDADECDVYVYVRSLKP